LGKNSAGTKDFGHPVTLAGTNLVVVNDAAKRAGNGYVTTDTSSGAFGSVLESAFKSIDENLGKIREALQPKKILPNTLVVISAKHGQGPIDATTLVQQGDNTPAALLSSDPT
jgi:membrane-anchored protein YejM (alkaline phosphatase superfamily)